MLGRQAVIHHQHPRPAGARQPRRHLRVVLGGAADVAATVKVEQIANVSGGGDEHGVPERHIERALGRKEPRVQKEGHAFLEDVGVRLLYPQAVDPRGRIAEADPVSHVLTAA